MVGYTAMSWRVMRPAGVRPPVGAVFSTYRVAVRYRSQCSGPVPGWPKISEVRSESGAVPQW
jgi:hypothetical protein